MIYNIPITSKDRRDVVAIAFVKNSKIALIQSGDTLELPHIKIRNFDSTDLVTHLNRILKSISPADQKIRDRVYDEFQSITFSCNVNSVKNDSLSLFQYNDDTLEFSDDVILKTTTQMFEDLGSSSVKYGTISRHYLSALIVCFYGRK